MQISESEPENLTEDSGKSDNEWSAAENISERQQNFNNAMYVFLKLHQLMMFMFFVLQSKG